MEKASGRPLTIAELIVWLDAIQREYGADTKVYFTRWGQMEKPIVTGSIRTTESGVARVILTGI
jgi:hypothetical protein